MAEYIMNPRRAPRAPARCRAAIMCRAGRFEGDTEDIGSMGCQVVSPEVVREGDAIRLLITADKIGEPLQAAGRVAWVSAQAPWRAGIAFDDACLGASARWFDRLISVTPGLANYRRVPDRILTEETVYLGHPPRFLLDFTRDEATLLRAIGSGARVDELMARLRDRWPAAQRALFSLIARGAVTLQRGRAVLPDTWKKILTDIEASLAVETLGKDGTGEIASPERPAASPATRPAVTPPPAATGRPGARSGLSFAPGWRGGEGHDPTRFVDLDDTGPSVEIDELGGGAAGWRNATRGRTVKRDYSGARVGWRTPTKRSEDAQVAYERGLAEFATGNQRSAVAFLRIALTLAPGDPEIAQQLGKIAFSRRNPGDH